MSRPPDKNFPARSRARCRPDSLEPCLVVASAPGGATWAVGASAVVASIAVAAGTTGVVAAAGAVATSLTLLLLGEAGRTPGPGGAASPTSGHQAWPGARVGSWRPLPAWPL